MKKKGKMILNKLYDKREFSSSHVQELCKKFEIFSTQLGVPFHLLKWFEYTYALLFSQHKYPGTLLDVGSAETLFPYFCAAYQYQVTTLDLEYSKVREEVGKQFNITALVDDLREFNPTLQKRFEFITCLSVIEHIDEDTKAILNVGSYVKPGGILFISTDFYKDYIEYPNANKTLVTDRPEGSHNLSRVYTEERFMNRVILPLEQNGFIRIGQTNYKNIDINNPDEYSVRRLYTFGIATLKRR